MELSSTASKTSTDSARTGENADALAYLYQQKLWPVLLLPGGKTPAWRGWNKRKPSLDRAIEWLREDGDMGHIPGRMGLAVFDVDEGDPSRLIRVTEPLTVCPTRRGEHLYWPDRTGGPRKDGRWTDVLGCRGDTRHNGQVKFHPGGLARLAHAVGTGIDRAGDFPADLFTRDEAPTLDTITSLAGLPTAATASPDPVELERALPGNRNCALFEALRQWAYRQDQGGDRELWLARCDDQAQAMRQTITNLRGFSEAEAAKTARSVGGWTWDNSEHSAGLDPGDSPAWPEWERLDRDARIVQAYHDGAALKVIAEAEGITTRWVRNIIDEAGPLFRRNPWRPRLPDADLSPSALKKRRQRERRKAREQARPATE